VHNIGSDFACVGLPCLCNYASSPSIFSRFSIWESARQRQPYFLSFSLQEWGNEFGTGFQITSPWFWHEKTAVKLGGSVLWKQDANWASFYVLRLGLIGGSFMANSDIRLYGEGGFLFLFPAASFDSDPFAFGGYGHFGFEFFMPKASGPLSSAYFIELGTNGIGAKTNSGQSYLNGFAVSTGLRVYL